MSDDEDHDPYEGESRENLIMMLEECQDTIEELEAKNHKLQNKKARRDAGGDEASDIAGLEQENERLRKAEMELQELRGEFILTKRSLEDAEKEREDLKRDVESKNRQVKALNEDLEAKKNQFESRRKAADSARKRDADDERDRTATIAENERMKEDIGRLEDSLREANAAKRDLEDEKREMIDEMFELKGKQDTFEADKRGLEDQILMLGEELDAAHQETEKVTEDKNKMTEQLENEKDISKGKVAEIQVILDAERQKTAELEQSIEEYKAKTSLGGKQREIEALTRENDQLKEEALVLAAAVDDAKRGAARAQELEDNFEGAVFERVMDANAENEILKKKIENLHGKLKDEELRQDQLERSRDELSREVEELKGWKRDYEQGNGMLEVGKKTMMLQEKSRQDRIIIQQYQIEIGKAKDDIGVLQQAFDRLKAEAGKPADFMYDEYDLHNEMMSENAKLRAQVAALDEQVTTLHRQGVSLRQTMRDQAGAWGEEGFKYAGLSPDQLTLVNQFAANLRDGTKEVPLNDRSAQLLRENQTLRETLELRMSSLREQGLHSSGDGGTGGAAQSGSRMNDADRNEMREDMKRIMAENASLNSRLVEMQSELLKTIRETQATRFMSTATTDGNTANTAATNTAGNAGVNDSLVHMVMANTEAMKKELLVELRKSQQLASSLSASIPRGAPQPIANIAYQQQAQQPPSAVSTPAVKLPIGTPMAGGAMSSHDFAQTAQSQRFVYTTDTFGAATPALQQPVTPHGKRLLSKTLANLNLPPEEWATEVKELNGQLIECLEQLAEREAEVTEQSTVISSLEDNLVSIKQQMAALYHDFSSRVGLWDAREKEYKQENEALRNQCDDLNLKVRETHKLIAAGKDDPQALETRVREMGRKLIVYEVNESILTRKYSSLTGQLEEEQQARHRHESDKAEMEGTLKRRILYLEQYKAASGARLARLQGKLDTSVPAADYKAVVSELESLRDDHLDALQRELDARISSLNSSEQALELRKMKEDHARLLVEADGERARVSDLERQLELQKNEALRMIAAGDNATEMSKIVSEMAQYRGDASRLEVELSLAQKNSGLLRDQLKEMTQNYEEGVASHRELTKRCEAADQRIREISKDRSDVLLKYEGGLTRMEAQEMRASSERQGRELEEAKRELGHQREIAEIASAQAQSIAVLKEERADELKELREYCNKLESRSDDELLIGRLQRQLMTTKTAYKGFIRKYQGLRSNMRQRELAVRILETQLDQREKALYTIQQTHRVEIGALKKALRSLDNMLDGADTDKSPSAEDIVQDVGPLLRLDGVAPGAVRSRGADAAQAGGDAKALGQRILSLSSKIGSLSTLAQGAVKRASEKQDEAERLGGDLQNRVAEVEILKARCEDLVVAATTQGSKQQVVASRLVSLSEEVKTHKLTSLQQRRQINVLRQEKRHFQGLLAAMTEDVEGLEAGKVLAETKGLLTELGADAQPEIDDEAGETTVADYKRLRGTLMSLTGDGGADASADGSAAPGSAVSADAEGLLGKLENRSNEVVGLRKELSASKLEREKLQMQNADLKGALAERDTQLKYYEGVVASEGLTSLQGRVAGGTERNVPAGAGAAGGRGGSNEKVQEAYAIKLSSMKSLLDEKKHECEKLRRQVDDLNLKVSRGQSAADRNAEALLARLDVEDGIGIRRKGDKAGAGLSGPGGTGVVDGHGGAGTEDLQRAHDIIDDKQREVDQVNQRLLAEANRRERAEVRCDGALREMEAMKSDLFTLANKLQESEERVMSLSKSHKSAGGVVGGGGGPNAAALQRQVKAKEEKMKGYREIIMRLKDAFVESEEDKALQIAHAHEKAKAAAGGGGSTTSGGVDGNKLDEMRQQVSALREGLRQAKEDLEADRKVRDKLSKARQAALTEAEKLEEQVGRAESVAAAAQEALGRCRRELEESKKKEMRLRDKLKDMGTGKGSAAKDLSDAKGGAGSGSSGGREGGDSKMEQLQREIEVLRAQNVALRKTVEEGGGSGGDVFAREDDVVGTKTTTAAASATFGGGGRGNVVGGGDHVPKDELRAQLHNKWESEKKLQKRVAQLEKRLREKLQENEDMHTQLKRAKEAEQSAAAAKSDALKKAANASKASNDMRRMASDDIDGVESARERVFKLEEEVSIYKRKAEVELASEISSLRHQASAMREKMGDLEAELLESEALRKKYASGMDAGAALRDSEDRFMKQERLKEDLEAARRQRLDLEAALLDRDSAAMENRFDLEARTQENDRLRRRCRELEAAYKAASRNAAAGGGLAGAGSTPRSPRSPRGGGSVVSASAATGKRERELEAVVEAMKRVVDKLKADNERLRKSGGPEERRANELEKRVASEKKRSERLDEELRGLAEKLRVAEEGSSRLTQRQNQVTQLKRQLKAKDDEHKDLLSKAAAAEGEATEHKRRAGQLEARIQQLEIQLASRETRSVAATASDGKRGAVDLQQKTTAQASEIERLKQDLAESRRILTAVQKEAKARTGMSEASLQGAELAGAELGKLRDAYRKVVGENEKLKEELSAFDLDFFEEIENLKYAHAEAMRKLRLYEN